MFFPCHAARDEADSGYLARQLGAHYFLRNPVHAQTLIDTIQWALDPEVQHAQEPAR